MAHNSIACVASILFIPPMIKALASEAVAQVLSKLAANVELDLDWFDAELNKSTGRFLVGDTVTVADIMVLFNIQFVHAWKIGTTRKSWPRIEVWRKNCEETDSYQRALLRTGYTPLSPEGLPQP